jgi:protein-S-isoprenylcysteine O-methyltransferase Ste14
VVESWPWGGWSLLLRSPTVAGATVLLGLGMSRAVILEEAAPATRFGRTWEAYAAQTHLARQAPLSQWPAT